MSVALFVATISTADAAPVIDLTEDRFRDLYGMRAVRYFNDPLVLRLCQAIERDDLAAIRQAIDDGVDVNGRGFAGVTPLLWAYPFDRRERMKLLLDAGADPTIRITGRTGIPGFNQPGMSVLTEASTTSPLETLKLVTEGRQWTDHDHWSHEPLLIAMIKGVPRQRCEKIQWYLQCGGDLSVDGYHDNDAVANALAVKAYVVAEYLLRCGEQYTLSPTWGTSCRDELKNTIHWQTVRPATARLLDMQRTIYQMIEDRCVQAEASGHAPDKSTLNDTNNFDPGTVLSSIGESAGKLRFDWYPRQRFIGSGEYFSDDRLDRQWIHRIEPREPDNTEFFRGEVVTPTSHPRNADASQK